MKDFIMKKFLHFSLFSLILLIAGSVNLYAQETGHYVPGIMGIKAATLPPPGGYYAMQNVFYTANTYNNAEGDAANINFDVNVFVTAQRFVYVWEDVFLGANYAVNVIAPLINTDISIGAFGVSDKMFGLGDIIIDPMVLGWYKKKYDLSFGIGAVMPTGSFDLTKPASPGKNMWTALFTFGGTYYFDEHKSWSASILSRFEIHSKKKDYDVTPGNDFTFEWGFGKTIPSKAIWSFGASGYAHWQVTEDKGDDIMYDPSVKDQVFAVGPEVDCYIPSIKLNLELRGLFEFGAIDRSQGTTVCLSLFKGL